MRAGGGAAYSASSMRAMGRAPGLRRIRYRSGPRFAPAKPLMKQRPAADTFRMTLRRIVVRRICRPSLRSFSSARALLVAAVVCAATLVPAASALAAGSVGTSEQIAWVRRAASNFVAAELSGNGAGACAILNAPLRTPRHHRTCAQRWNTKLSELQREPLGRAHLRALQRAIPSATVVVHGYTASIDLPTPLVHGPNRFLWTENCWMLEG